ncbi:ABC transporter ATP-binding protein [Kiritimatiellota bacterium B12222]|nr:ABC transporter ATP-binding protein [Kiritimatiellota bacterium B12222]
MSAPQQEKRPLRRLYRYSLRYKWRLTLGMLLGALTGGSIFGMLGQMKDATDETFSFGTVSLPTLYIACAALILIFLVRGLCRYSSVYLINWVGFKIVEQLRRESFAKLQKLQLGFYSKHSSGELMSRVTNDTTMVQHAVSGVVTDIATQPFALAGSLGYIIYTDWKLAILSLVAFPLCIAPVLIFGRKVRKYARQSQEHLADLSSVLQENVSGVRVVKAFCTEPHEEEKFDHENRKVFGRLIRIVLARNVNEPLMETVSAIGFAGLLVYANQSNMTVGEFISFAAALAMMYQPIKMLSKVHMEIQKAMGSAERIFNLLDEPVDVVENPEGEALQAPIEQIAFKNVCFSYNDEQVLHNINLSIREGEKVALVGSSGSGKSTLVSLVPRFYDPSSGSVSINNTDLKDLTFKGLRNQIALVTQDTFLFNDTIAKNIGYGEDTIDMERILDAAKRANAHDFIEEMAEGYQTRVGERGGRLSGGQKQRLAIARAIYRDAPILILDEATNALDTESEHLVQSAINQVMEGRTSIAIAHRLSTIQHSDRILVMQEGRIVEEGNHQALLDQNGVYRRLYDIQFSA